jgi:hypothetical protein
VRVWVETDEPCTVEVLGHRSHTWTVAGHHYALVELHRLEPGTDTPYEVHLDGEVVWPTADDPRPPPRIQTWSGDGPIDLVVGSCRQAAPPSWLDHVASERDPPGVGTDSLAALAHQLATGERIVHGLILLGDQVYADEPDPQTVDALQARRGGRPSPGCPEVSSFEEFTWLYREAWSTPSIRWLLASVPSVMIFDDHDVIDDWNTSQAWRDEIERRPWWAGRIEGGLMAYWVYQHVGNVGRSQADDSELLDEIEAAGPDGERPLRAFARRADLGTPDDVGHRWSFACDLGSSRLLMVDSRNGRILDEHGRSMLGKAEWSWLDEQMNGDVEHLFVATSVPWLLPRSIHDLESWDDAVAGGAWGRRAAGVAEWLRQYVDLEHWASFGRSFHELADLIRSVSSGARGDPPETVTVLSGDVHFGYVAETSLEGRSRVYQVVSSPFRQAIPFHERFAQRQMLRAPASLLCRALVATTPQARPRFGWEVTDGPWFDDHLVDLTVDGADVRVAFEVAGLDDQAGPTLTRIAERRL